MPKIACDSCVFYVRMTSSQGAQTRGKCRRFPPLVYFDTHAKQTSELWPTVNENWWCGEYRAPRRTGANGAERRDAASAQAGPGRRRGG